MKKIRHIRISEYRDLRIFAVFHSMFTDFSLMFVSCSSVSIDVSSISIGFHRFLTNFPSIFTILNYFSPRSRYFKISIFLDLEIWIPKDLSMMMRFTRHSYHFSSSGSRSLGVPIVVGLSGSKSLGIPIVSESYSFFSQRARPNGASEKLALQVVGLWRDHHHHHHHHHHQNESSPSDFDENRSK